MQTREEVLVQLHDKGGFLLKGQERKDELMYAVWKQGFQNEVQELIDTRGQERFSFGKHRGKTFQEVFDIVPMWSELNNYFLWALRKIDSDDVLHWDIVEGYILSDQLLQYVDYVRDLLEIVLCESCDRQKGYVPYGQDGQPIEKIEEKRASAPELLNWGKNNKIPQYMPEGLYVKAKTYDLDNKSEFLGGLNLNEEFSPERKSERRESRMSCGASTIVLSNPTKSLPTVRATALDSLPEA